MMEDIEALEQTLIQHLRTSGLRPNKEISLIDEILEIRKRRRQLFANLDGQMKTNHQETEQRIQEAIREKEEAKALLIKWKEEQTKDLQALEKVMQEREEILLQQENAKLEKLQIEWGSKFNKLKKHYQQDLQVLEAKCIRITQEKELQKEDLTESLTQTIRESLKHEYEKKYEEKVAE